MDTGTVLGISAFSRHLPLACRARDWWWVPVVAPFLGAYLGGIIYLVFIGSTITRRPHILEDSMMSEDRRIPVLPKTMQNPAMTSPLTPVSVSPTVRTVPPLSDPILLEQF